MTLIAKAIPPVSREFALELKKRFRPFTVTPGFDRDELMQSVGEQRVIDWILYHSNNFSIKSNLDSNTNNNTIPDKVPDTVEEPVGLFKRWSNRFGQ